MKSLLCSAVWGISFAVVSIACAQEFREVPEVLIQWPDTIYHNAQIVTMDDTALNNNPGSIVEAMAIRGEVILALGSNDEILSMEGPDTEIVDLHGKQVLPGFVATHIYHMRGAGMPPDGVSAREAALLTFGLPFQVEGYYMNTPVEATPEEVLSKLEYAVGELRKAVDVGEDQWIGVHLDANPAVGYPGTATVSTLMDIDDPPIDRADLDQIVPDRMFMLGSGYLIGPTSLPEESTWYYVGPHGGLERITNFEWIAKGKQDENGFEPPEPRLSAKLHEAGIGHSSHRTGLPNSVGYERTIKVWPSFKEALDLNTSSVRNAGERGIIKASAIRSTLREVWSTLPTAAQYATGYIQGSPELWSRGITQLATRMDMAEQIAGYYMLAREEGRLPYRATYHYALHTGPFTGEEMTTSMYSKLGNHALRIEDGNHWIWLNGVGVGTIGDAAGMSCLGPDLPARPGVDGKWLKEEYEGCRVFEEPLSPAAEGTIDALRSGWRTNELHGHGSGMIRLFVEQLEKAMEANPDLTLERVRKNRYGFAHGTMIGKVPEVIEMALKYNLSLSLNLQYAFREELDVIDKYYGPEGYQFIPPTRTLIEAGVDVNDDGANFTSLASHVNRIDPRDGTVILPEERIDRVTAFKLINIGNARSNFSEKLTGSLEVGKLADFFILDRDFLDSVAVPDEELPDLEQHILMTVIGDEVVWTNATAPQEWKDREYAWSDHWFEGAKFIRVRTTEKPLRWAD